MPRILRGVRVKGLSVIGKITSKISNKINRAFGLKGPGLTTKTSKLYAGGHRGIHMTSRILRERRVREGLPEYTTEEIERWRNFTGDIIQAFMEDHYPLFVHSSNVVLAQYFPETSKMLVEFKKGAYLYSNVSEAEALEFAQSQSKGSFIWDRFRVRGSRTAHRKPYTKIR